VNQIKKALPGPVQASMTSKATSLAENTVLDAAIFSTSVLTQVSQLKTSISTVAASVTSTSFTFIPVLGGDTARGQAAVDTYKTMCANAITSIDKIFGTEDTALLKAFDAKRASSKTLFQSLRTATVNFMVMKNERFIGRR
jgi:hypothetical protein